MAWPPGVLPINRSDATPQQTTHAADHNAANQAINDTVAHVQATEGGNLAAFTAMIAGLQASPTARFRMWSATVSATTDAGGALIVTIPSGTFANPPIWVIADDFYVGGPPANPANWYTYKIDGSTLTTTNVRIVVGSLRTGTVAANTPLGFKIVAFGVWSA
jgi:hypothetical protein